MSNDKTATLTVQQQLRLEAVNFAGMLEARRLERLRFTDSDESPAVDIGTVLVNAEKIYKFTYEGVTE